MLQPQVYKSALLSAKEQNISLLVFPEGYALGTNPNKKDYYEPFDVNSTRFVGSNPCLQMDVGKQPELVTLSCASKNAGVAAAANIFTMGTQTAERHITEIVFSSEGVLLSAYNKHHLFETEKAVITPGPFKPTSIDMFGRRWGLVICYEGNGD